MLKKIFGVTAFLVMAVGIGSHAAWGKDPARIPDRDCTFWGTAYIDGVALTRDDTGHTVSLRINGEQEDLASYTMGSELVNGDWYVLRVPMSIGERQPGTAQTGDTAHIYINGILISEAYLEPDHQSIALPTVIGDPAETMQIDIYQIIGGNPPVASDLMIVPVYPKTGDDLVGSYTYSDEEGNPESDLTEIRWYRDNVWQTDYDDGLVVPYAATARGQKWYFTVRPHDGFSFGELQTSPTVIVCNTPPEASDPSISPQPPFTGDDLLADYTYSDADGDPESGTEIRWYKDGNLQTDYHDMLTLPSSATAKGQQWRFTIKPSDGTDFGGLQISPIVTIENTPPEASEPHISPALPLTGDDLVANYTYSDADGDPEIGTTIRWYKNDNMQSQHNDQKIVTSSATAKGQQWRFTVRPGDGTGLGRYQTSPTVTIGNTPPVADADGPYEVQAAEEVIFDGSGSFDPDGDLLTTYSWDFGDDNTGSAENPSHTYSMPDVYIVTLIVNDGTIGSAPSTTVAYVGTNPDWIQPVTFDLADGWNLISVPGQHPNTGIDSVLSSIQGQYDSIWAYDAMAGEWLRYIVGGPPSQNNLDEIKPGLGYWIEMNQPGVLEIYGIRPPTAIPLKDAWNLVGYNSETAKAIEDCMSSIETQFDSVQTYDSDQGKWLKYIPDGPLLPNNIEYMQPGKGYWIHVKEECIWDIGP